MKPLKGEILMNCDILINFVSSNNEESILCTEYVKPKEVVFLYKDDSKIENLKNYYETTYKNIKFTSIEINDYTKLYKVIAEYEGRNALIDISAAGKAVSLAALYESYKRKIDVIYMDINKKEIIRYGQEGITKSKAEFPDLDIDHIMKSIGAKILIESTEIGEEEVICKLTKLIASHMKEWNEIRPALVDSNIIVHCQNDSHIITVKTDNLTDSQSDTFYKTVNLLKEYGQIKCFKKGNEFKIEFLSKFIKGFIFKTGSWFEIFTKMVVEEIEFIDDVKSGMMFLWDKNQNRIKNEIDVVAIKDGVVICISCKDSAKYDENALNELNVYSEKIGGENAVKILTATKYPDKTSVKNRAEEMGIDIIVYNGDKNKFKQDIRNSILKKAVK